MSNVLASFKAKLQKMDKDFKTASALHLKIGVRRKLTAGEIQMCQLVFKNSIDYSKVLINIGGYIHSKTGNAMTPAGEIVLPRSEYITNLDFSKSKGGLQHWFIHEMTHVWQYQLGAPNGWFGIKHLCNGGYTSQVNSVDSGKNELKAYDTDLLGRDYNKKFNDFNFEQQGRIIEFWFDAMYLRNIDPTRQHHQTSLQLLPKVRSLLNNFLTNPNDKFLLPKE
ncbi:zinc protease [Acinetobacter rongchengensis]|uniref:Zinc protease n=1 Tax=Acinetobacter rongchengensis TaxID=2419601 RepID=A0A3A8ENE6_9GAMM|nr:zinc protease [Acinetobacter rongchengensis]RKG30381.1 zinc protease [Acinetobacter rongchengensis]